MSAPQPPADGQPNRPDGPEAGGASPATGDQTARFDFHGEQLDFDPYRFGRPEEPPRQWDPTAPGRPPGAAPTPGDRWSPGGDPGAHEVRPGDWWDGAGAHRGPFPPAGYVPPPGGDAGGGPDGSAPPRIDLGKPGGTTPGGDTWAPPAGPPSSYGTPGQPPTHPYGYPPANGPTPGAYPGAYPGAPGGHGGPTHGRGGNGLAIAGLVVGIIGVLLSITSWPGLLLGLVGLGLAIPALVKARRSGAGKGLAIAGLVLSGIAVVLSTVVLVWVLSRVDLDCVIDANGDTSQAQECIR